MIKNQKQCFKHIFNGLDFVNWKFNEFFRFDFADSFLDSWNDRFNVFGLAFDFFKFGIEKTGSIVGKFFDFVPFDLNFFEVGLTLKELFFEECKSLFNGRLDVDVMLFLFLIGFEKWLGEFLALIDGLSEFLDLWWGFFGFWVIWHAMKDGGYDKKFKNDRNFEIRKLIMNLIGIC